MDIGLHYPRFAFPDAPLDLVPALVATARAADAGGCRTLTLMDHWFQMESIGDARDPMLDGYTTLGFLAGQTTRIELGLLVTGVTYRHPGLLAKTVATLDVLSGGRAMLGIGAAWYEREHRGLGVPFPPLGTRFELLEETLEVCGQMWSADDGPFDGAHVQLAETICSPPPVRRPRIVIGGSGERKTLRLVAQYGDACNLFAPSVEVVAHKLQVLERHCDEVGRDPAQVARTILTATDPLADVDGFLATMEAHAALGVGQVWIYPAGPDPVAWTERVTAEVVPWLGALGSG